VAFGGREKKDFDIYPLGLAGGACYMGISECNGGVWVFFSWTKSNHHSTLEFDFIYHRRVAWRQKWSRSFVLLA